MDLICPVSCHGHSIANRPGFFLRIGAAIRFLRRRRNPRVVPFVPQKILKVIWKTAFRPSPERCRRSVSNPTLRARLNRNNEPASNGCFHRKLGLSRTAATAHPDFATRRRRLANADNPARRPTKGCYPTGSRHQPPSRDADGDHH